MAITSTNVSISWDGAVWAATTIQGDLVAGRVGHGSTATRASHAIAALAISPEDDCIVGLTHSNALVTWAVDGLEETAAANVLNGCSRSANAAEAQPCPRFLTFCRAQGSQWTLLVSHVVCDTNTKVVVAELLQWPSLERMASFEHAVTADVLCVDMFQDGKTVVVCSKDAVAMRTISTSSDSSVQQEQGGYPHTATTYPVDRQVAAACAQMTSRVVSADQLGMVRMLSQDCVVEAQRHLDSEAGSPIIAVAFLGQEQYIAVLSSSQLLVLDAVKLDLLASRNHNQQALALTGAMDGCRLCTAGNAVEDLRLWSFSSPQQLDCEIPMVQSTSSLKHQPRPYAQPSTHVTSGPATSLASCDVDGRVRVWDGATGDLIFDTAPQKSAMTGCSLSACGEYLYSCSVDGTACVWSLSKQRLLRKLELHAHLEFVVVSASGLVCFGTDQTLEFYSSALDQCLCTSSAHSSGATYAAWDPCSDQIVSVARQKYAFVHTLGRDGRTRQKKIDLDAVVTHCRWLSSGIILFASQEGKVLLYDSSSLNRLAVFPEHAGPISSLDAVEVEDTHAGIQVATAGADGHVRILHLRRDRHRHRTSVHFQSSRRLESGTNSDHVSSCVFVARGQMVAIARQAHAIEVYSAEDMQQLRLLVDPWDSILPQDRQYSLHGAGQSASASAASFIGHENALIVGDSKGHLYIKHQGSRNLDHIIDLASSSRHQDVQTVELRTARRRPVSPKEEAQTKYSAVIGVCPVMGCGRQTIVVATSRGDLFVIDCESWHIVHRRSIGRRISCIAASEDMVLVGCDQDVIQLSSSLGTMSSFSGHRDKVRALDIDSHGETCLTTSQDGTAFVLDVADLEERVQICSPTLGRLVAGQFNGEGTRACIGGSDGFCAIFCCATGALLTSLTGHTRSVKDVSWLHDDSMIATVSEDATLRVWHSSSGCEIACFRPHAHPIVACTSSRIGDVIATISMTGDVSVTDLTSCTLLSSVNLLGALKPRAENVPAPADDAENRHAELGYSRQPRPHWNKSAVGVSTDSSIAVVASPAAVYAVSLPEGHVRPFITDDRRTSSVNAVCISPDNMFVMLARGRTVEGYALHSLVGDTANSRAELTGAMDEPIFSFSAGRTIRSLDISAGGRELLITSNDTAVIVVHLIVSVKKLNFQAGAAHAPTSTSSPMARRRPTNDGIFSATNRPPLPNTSTPSKPASLASDEYVTAIQRVAETTFEQHTARVICGRFSPSGRVVATGDGDRRILLWHTPTRGMAFRSPITAKLAGHTRAVQSVAWSEGGTLLASSSEDRSVRVWDTRGVVSCAMASKEGRGEAALRRVPCVAVIADAHSSIINTVSFLNSQLLAISGIDDKINILSIPTQHCMHSFVCQGRITSTAVAANKVFSVSDAGALDIFDADADFAVWLGVQAFNASQRSATALGTFSAVETVMRFARSVWPLMLANHSRNQPDTLIGIALQHFNQPDVTEACIRGLLRNLNKPVLLTPYQPAGQHLRHRTALRPSKLRNGGNDLDRSLSQFKLDVSVHAQQQDHIVPKRPGARQPEPRFAASTSHTAISAAHPSFAERGAASALDVAIDKRCRAVVALLLDNMRHHPLGRTRLVFTRALPALSRIFPDLAAAFLDSALVPTQAQPVRNVLFSSDSDVKLMTGPTSAPPAAVATLESSMGVPARTYVVALPHFVDWYAWKRAASDPLSQLATNDVAQAFRTSACKAAGEFKWRAWCRRFFLSQLFIYLAFVACLSYVCARLPLMDRRNESPLDWISQPQRQPFRGSASPTARQLIHLVALLVLCTVNVWFLAAEAMQAAALGIRYLFNAWNLLDVTVQGLTPAFLALHLLGMRQQLPVAAVLVFLAYVRCISFTRGFESTGIFVRMLVRIVGFSLPFVVVLLSFLSAFAFAFFVVFRQQAEAYQDLGRTFLTLFYAMFGDLAMVFSASSGDFRDPDTGHPNVSLFALQLVLFVAYFTVVCIVLVNALIALMASAYEEVQSNARCEWLKERAKLMADMESIAGFWCWRRSRRRLDDDTKDESSDKDHTSSLKWLFVVAPQHSTEYHTRSSSLLSLLDSSETQMDQAIASDGACQTIHQGGAVSYIHQTRFTTANVTVTGPGGPDSTFQIRSPHTARLRSRTGLLNATTSSEA